MSELAERAAEIGREHGYNAGTWVFDGNTDRATYAAVLAGIEEGDPLILDAYHVPDLTDADFGATDLAAELGVDVADTETEDAYRMAAEQAFWGEVERAARYQLS